MIWYAKPDQTYRQHLMATFDGWRSIMERHRGPLDRLEGLYGISSRSLMVWSLLALSLHDLGKLSEPFQRRMEAVRAGRRCTDENYRHEMLSLPWVFRAEAALWKDLSLPNFPLASLAVLGHHLPVDSELSRFDRERRWAENSSKDDPEIYPDGAYHGLDIAKEMFDRMEYVFPDFSPPQKWVPYGESYRLMGKQLPLLMERGLNGDWAMARDLLVFIKGSLCTADWLGSAGKVLAPAVRCDEKSLGEVVRARCENRGTAFTGFRSFQVEMGSIGGNGLVVAPTGSGKTEGSLLWALNKLGQEDRRILYLLPTRNTATAMWRRLGDIFGEDNVGLAHSTAFLDRQGEDEPDDGKSRLESLQDGVFIKPITVGTVDQLLSCSFSWGRWPMKEFFACNGAIILDEIHCYDGWTMGLISSAIDRFSRTGAEFLVMTATMPLSAQEFFSRRLGASVLRGLVTSPDRSVSVRDLPLDDSSVLDDIRKSVSMGKKTMVVANSIDLCQRITRELEDLSPLCLHSRFIMKDRVELERKVEDASLLIATQVVEVSLDLDYDVLFTECAPPDCLIQRFGRINRRGREGVVGEIVVLRYSDVACKIYSDDGGGRILDRTMEELPLGIDGLVDRVYGEISPEDVPRYRDGKLKGDEAAKDLLGVWDSAGREKDQKTRISSYPTVTVIPQSLFDVIAEIPLPQWRRYSLDVPVWYAKDHSSAHRGQILCDMTYDPLLGGIMEPSIESCFA